MSFILLFVVFLLVSSFEINNNVTKLVYTIHDQGDCTNFGSHAERRAVPLGRCVNLPVEGRVIYYAQDQETLGIKRDCIGDIEEIPASRECKPLSFSFYKSQKLDSIAYSAGIYGFGGYNISFYTGSSSCGGLHDFSQYSRSTKDTTSKCHQISNGLYAKIECKYIEKNLDAMNVALYDDPYCSNQVAEEENWQDTCRSGIVDGYFAKFHCVSYKNSDAGKVEEFIGDCLGLFAVEGSISGAKTEDLYAARVVRDNILSRFPLGRTIINAWYEISPKANEVMNAHPIFKAATRFMLSPFIAIARAMF